MSRSSTSARAALTALLGIAAARGAGCASGAGSAPASACSGFTSPQPLLAAPVSVPQHMMQTRVGGLVICEVMVDRAGAVQQVRVLSAPMFGLGSALEAALRKSSYTPAAIQGNPVAARFLVSRTVGAPGRSMPGAAVAMLHVYVPGDESRKARWQLAGSVRRLAIEARLDTPAPKGAQIVARAPGGAERVLAEVPAATGPQYYRATVKAGGFFDLPGDYGLSVRRGESDLTWAVFTVADDYTRSIVNACTPGLPEGTGPEPPALRP